MDLSFIVGYVLGGLFMGLCAYFHAKAKFYKQQIDDVKYYERELRYEYTRGRNNGYEEGFKAGKRSAAEGESGLLI